jgi:hypothetical protein
MGDFFFFRGAGDRATVQRFATTIASQLAAAMPSSIPHIEAAIKANPGILSLETTSLPIQFQHLVLEPLQAATLDRVVASVRGKSFLIVLDGLDECADREEVSALIDHMIQFFNKKSRSPLRILVTSRVESHLHQSLHSSNQVKLLDLVSHTSDDDISVALDVAIEKEKKKRLLACEPLWPSPRDRWMLVKHIGGSYIFMTTLIQLLFDSQSKDGLTPMDRLPLVLGTSPDFDGLYRTILEPWTGLPHFRSILSTIALARVPLSVTQIADLLGLSTFDIVNALVNLHAIVQVPGDDHSPVTLWHTSLRDFLTVEARSGPFFADPAHHKRLSEWAVRKAASTSSGPADPDRWYGQNYGMDHLLQYLQTVGDEHTSYIILLQGIVSDLVNAIFRGMSFQTASMLSALLNATCTRARYL